MGKGPHPEYPPYLICEEIEMKCRVCKKDKEVSEYYKNSSKVNGINTECKECTKVFRKNYYSKNKEKIIERTTNWIKDNPERHKNNEMQRKYGISYEEYSLRRNNQDGKCLICGKTEKENGIDLAVDHCHATGTVRGLLCVPCNRGLGMFKDNSDLLLKAFRYLSNEKL